MVESLAAGISPANPQAADELITGAIQHPGWRVKELKLATPPEGADEFVLQPAEVQIP